MEEKKDYTELSTVEKRDNFLTAEEFPDGPYGSPIRKNKPVENKSTRWKDGQRFYSNFNYEDKTFHQDIPRQMEGAHPTHDDPNQDENPRYTH